MSYKIYIYKDAKKDFRKSYNWYNDINKSLANRFNSSFNESLLVLLTDPFLFQIRFDDTRIKKLTSFPYLIHYKIVGHVIIVKAVLHSSRDSDLNKF